MSDSIFITDYSNPQHADMVLSLLEHYALDEMGGGGGLSDNVKDTLISSLAQRAFAFSVLAVVDGTPAGLANCFEGFSTFAAKPLVNIHDLVVHADFRGRGLSHALLKAVEQEAQKRGCVKVTLEVLSNNDIAVASYKKFGFAPYVLDPAAGPAQFWQKSI
jgi:ribosomal protein S18 acetylase RimI-like enzyme